MVGYSLAPHTSLLVPSSGSKGPVVHVHGLTGSRKTLCESRLDYLYPCIWCAWTVGECSFNVISHKMNFNCCANRDGFRIDSHIYIYIYIYVILHLPNIINHCDNSNVQQKEERLVSSTHLFILTKRLRLTITNTSFLSVTIYK